MKAWRLSWRTCHGWNEEFLTQVDHQLHFLPTACPEHMTWQSSHVAAPEQAADCAVTISSLPGMGEESTTYHPV
jgi:hypothetical protein